MRALFIDGMGTLVRLLAPVPRLREVVGRRYGVELGEDDARHALRAEIAFYRANMLQGRDHVRLARLRERCADALFGALGLAPSVEALMEVLAFEAFDDARCALVGARAAGLRVIVVSNWDVSLVDVLEQVGLAPLVDAVVVSAAVGAAKPEVAIFEHALALAGCAASEVVHVGDSLAEDVAGARAVGLRAVLLRRDGGGEPGVETIASLSELRFEP